MTEPLRDANGRKPPQKVPASRMGCDLAQTHPALS
jgi:hypothetical protein